MMREKLQKHKVRFIKACAVLLFAGLIGFVPHTPQAQSKAPSIIRDTEIEAIFKGWATPLLKAAQIGDQGVNIVLVQSNDVNAFVAGGANIFFYTGLIQKTDTPGEVIGVLAHEIGHIAGGHLIAMQGALERASYESILGTVLGIGAALATGNGAAATAIMSATHNTAARRFLKHSRVNESAADQAAFSYMEESKINPSGLSTFLEKLENQELLPSSQQSEYVRTHPITRDRIEAVDARVNESPLNGQDIPALWTEQHARMKAKLVGFISPEQVAWTYEDNDNSIAARYARAIAAYRLNDIPTALRGIDELISDEPENAYFQELKGQMLVDFGRVDEAVPYYQRSVELLPDAPLLRTALAHALLESGASGPELKEAVTHLDRALVVEKRSSRVHRLLATAHGKLGNESKAKLHLAEEAVLQNRLPYAKAQAEAALKGFQTGSSDWLRTKDVLSHIANLERI